METLERSAIAISDNIYSILPACQPTQKMLSSAKIIAHRGEFDNKNTFENTLAAFDRCIKNEFVYGIEFDIRWTKDLTPVVFHDIDAQRVFNSKIKISDLSLEELKIKLPLIPTLEEVVSKYGGKIHFMIELKNDESFNERSPQEMETQFKKISKLLEGLTAKKDYHIMTFHTELFKYLKTTPSDCFLPIVQWSLSSAFNDIVAKNYGGVTSHYLLFTKYYRKLFNEKKIPVGIGYVDSINNFKIQCHNEITWMFTNKPLLISNFLKQHLKGKPSS